MCATLKEAEQHRGGFGYLFAWPPNASVMPDELPKATAAALLFLGGPGEASAGRFAEVLNALYFS